MTLRLDWLSLAVLLAAGCGAPGMSGAGGGTSGGLGASGGGTSGAGGASSSAIARTIGGTVGSNVTKVGLLGVSGKTYFAPVQSGAFKLDIPNEPFGVVFYGSNGRVLANLVSKQGARSQSVFPWPRGVTRQPLTGNAARQPLLTGTDLSIGTVTVTVTITVEAQYNLLADIDTDGDGTPDATDTDDDGDGLADDMEPKDACDPDGDGALSLLDADDDGDGTPDEMDTDDDGDGIADAMDLDDDGDGTVDSMETPDTTPDALVGEWLGVTEVTDFSFAQGRPVPLNEHFSLRADGQMTGLFETTDATSGCHVKYTLQGTWADALDAAHVLDVEWTRISFEVTQCTTAANDTNGVQDVRTAETSLWHDELDGYWFVAPTASPSSTRRA